MLDSVALEDVHQSRNVIYLSITYIFLMILHFDRS